jgi:hypothetical protein
VRKEEVEVEEALKIHSDALAALHDANPPGVGGRPFRALFDVIGWDWALAQHREAETENTKPIQPHSSSSLQPVDHFRSRYIRSDSLRSKHYIL